MPNTVGQLREHLVRDIDDLIEQAQDEAETKAASQARPTAGVGSEGTRGPQSNVQTEGAIISEGLTRDTQQPGRIGAGITGG